MSLPNLSGVGRLTQDPEIRYSANGNAVATLNLAFNSRKRDEAGNWVDGDVFYIRATAFKQLAENAANTLSRGMEVNVSGRLKTEQWQDKNTGDKRSAAALILDSIGPNLAFATANVHKVSRDSAQPSASTPSDPWATPAPVGGGQQAMPDDEPPF